MHFLEKVSFEDVLDSFRFYHNSEQTYKENTNRDTEISLLQANELLGEWSKVLLGQEDILSIILPWHLGCGGKIELVPKSGLTVQQAVEKIRSTEAEFSFENPVCYSKLQQQRKQDFTPLFLTTQAVNRVYYAELKEKKGLVHIDGLHRMIAWILYGRLADNVFVEAYIAGQINSIN